MTLPDNIKQKLDGARSQIEGMGAVLKVQYGPAAYALYKALVDRKGFSTLAGTLIENALTKAQYDAFMELLNLNTENYITLLIEAAVIPEDVQQAVRASVANADVIQIDVATCVQQELDKLRKLAGG